MVKAADMLIARRADTRARADFATWKMMAKLNGASALPQHAQDFLLAGFRTLFRRDVSGDFRVPDNVAHFVADRRHGQ